MTGANQPYSSSSSINQSYDDIVGFGGVVAEIPGGKSFVAIPLRYCQHLKFVKPLPDTCINVRKPCTHCKDCSENWLCLTCYKVFCSRYVNKHGLKHFQANLHPMTLSFSDLSCWCYECKAYVHNDVLIPAKEAAYVSKFGDLPPATAPPRSFDGTE